MNKSYVVTLTVPAFMDMIVSAESEDAAIMQAIEFLESDCEIEIEIDGLDIEPDDFYVYLLNQRSGPQRKDAPKKVPTPVPRGARAVQPKPNPKSGAVPIEVKISMMTEIVQVIRDSDLSDRDMAFMILGAIDEQFVSRDHPHEDDA